MNGTELSANKRFGLASSPSELRYIIAQSWLSFMLPFLLYLRTLAPTVYNLDSAELTTAVASNGIVRATGYPLYLLIGKLFVWLPFGDAGYRLNLFSATCGALTVYFADRILLRLQVPGWARWGALGMLATAPYFWAMSLVAEVYTLHTALLAGTLLALLRWSAAPTPWRLALPVFLLTLSLGNHAATVLLIPACVWFVMVQQPRVVLRGQVWLVCGGALFAGLSIFLLLPWRYGANPAFNYAGVYDATGTFIPINLQTWSGLWWLISGKAFSGQMFGYRWYELGPELRAFGVELWTAFFALGIGPGLVGLAALFRRDWRLGSTFFLTFVANAAFYINYRVIDKATMYLPVYLIWALWLGLGYQTLATWARRDQPGQRLSWALRAAAVLIVLLPLGWNWGRVDRSQDWSTREQSEAILALVEPNALVFGWWDTVPGLQYLQLVEKQRPDVMVINRFLISGADMNHLILSELGQRPIYLNNPSVELLRRARASPIGPLYKLDPLPGAVPRGNREEVWPVN